MDREKAKKQIQILRNKQLMRQTVQPKKKEIQVQNGVVRVEGRVIKQQTMAPPTAAPSKKLDEKIIAESARLNTEKKKVGGCTGCRRKLGH
jgi:hypothetical protein